MEVCEFKSVSVITSIGAFVEVVDLCVKETSRIL